MGDTALIRSVGMRAKQLWPRVRIVGVQAANAPAYYLSWRAGTAIATATCDTMADGLATRRPVDGHVQAIRRIVDDVQLVGEHDLLAAVGSLLHHEHLVVEPAGASTLAAWRQTPEHSRAQTTVLLLTGSNVAPDVLRQAAALALDPHPTSDL